jgi:ketosteroid isomerase-like protein
MLHENAELVRRVWQLAVVDRDFAAAMELAHADVEYDWSDSRAPYAAVYRGHDEIKGAWLAWLEAWDEWIPEIVEAIEVDPGTVVVVTRIHARGKGSGVPVRAEGASAWYIVDGKVARAKLYQSKAEALDAVSRPAT